MKYLSESWYFFRYPVHHCAKISKLIESDRRLSAFAWPAAFGDIMPIETVWDDVLAKLEEQNIRVHTEDELWLSLRSTFIQLCDDQYVTRLVSDIPKKLRQLVRLKGALVV